MEFAGEPARDGAATTKDTRSGMTAIRESHLSHKDGNVGQWIFKSQPIARRSDPWQSPLSRVAMLCCYVDVSHVVSYKGDECCIWIVAGHLGKL